MVTTQALRNAVLAVLLAASAAAAKGYEKQPPLYLDRAKLAAQQVPPAPAADSAADQADLVQVRDWQKRRTEKQCQTAQAQAHATFDEFFGDISPFVKPLPQEQADFLLQVAEDIDAAVGGIKDREQRPRPFRRDSSLRPCIKKLGGSSYPSGHAAISRVYALMLGELAPQHRNEFMTRANDAALYRVIAGVHHPSDIAAGKQLGDLLYLQFRRDPAFQAQMERLRSHLAK
jgi:acid phosphatase (class A)